MLRSDGLRGDKFLVLPRDANIWRVDTDLFGLRPDASRTLIILDRTVARLDVLTEVHALAF